MSNSMQVLFLVALVAGGLGTYHVLVADDAGSTAVVTQSAPDNDDMERRIAALEGREPMLQGSVDTTALWNRLRDIESRLKDLEDPGRIPAQGESPSGDHPRVAVGNQAGASLDEAVSEGELRGALKKRVDSLVESAISTRMRGRMGGRLDRSLEELGIELSAGDRKKLDAAMAERMKSFQEIMRSGRASGLSREDMGEQMAAVSAKFTETVSTFMPVADAQAIAAATEGPPGGGRGRGPGR